MTGVAYSLFSGQPLTILGSTGPVLVFEKILFKFCKYVQHAVTSVTLSVTRDLMALVSSKGLPPVLPVTEGLHRPVDGPAVFGVGCHRC